MKGLPFNAQQALAVWEGRKTVARGFIEDQPYSAGEVVYMQEPWVILDYDQTLIYKADCDQDALDAVVKLAERWKPSVTMSSKDSRLHIRLTVRPERLRDITVDEIKKEGISEQAILDSLPMFPSRGANLDELIRLTVRHLFADMWNSIYPDEHSFLSNPWVWRYGLEEVWRKGRK